MKQYICPKATILRFIPQLMQTASLPVIKDGEAVTDSDDVYTRRTNKGVWDD